MISLLSLLLTLFTLLLLARAVLSWVPNKTGTLASVDRFVFSLTEPVLAPVRRVIPPMGGLDMSFIVVFLGIWIVQAVFLHG